MKGLKKAVLLEEGDLGHSFFFVRLFSYSRVGVAEGVRQKCIPIFPGSVDRKGRGKKLSHEKALAFAEESDCSRHC